MKSIDFMRSYFMIALALLFAGSALAATDLRYTDLIDLDEDWCRSLRIQVSGVAVSSADYYIAECGESTEKNVWYCNCDPDDEFRVTFVNRKSDTKSYIVDIKSDVQTTSIRRVVSVNQLAPLNTSEGIFGGQGGPVPDTKLEDLEDRLDKLNQRLDSLSSNIGQRIDNLDAKVNSVSVQASPYDDSAILRRMAELEAIDPAAEKAVSDPQENYLLISAWVMAFLLLAGGGFYIYRYINHWRKRNGN